MVKKKTIIFKKKAVFFSKYLKKQAPLRIGAGLGL